MLPSPQFIHPGRGIDHILPGARAATRKTSQVGFINLVSVLHKFHQLSIAQLTGKNVEFSLDAEHSHLVKTVDLVFSEQALVCGDSQC